MINSSHKLAILTLHLGVVGLLGCTDKKASIQFLGEDNAPIKDARFFFYEFENGAFKAARYRDFKMNDRATIDDLGVLPKEYQFGIVSQSKWYHQFWRQTDVQLVLGHNLVRLERSGSILLQFTKVDEEIVKRLKGPVLVHYRQDRDGLYKMSGGVGIGDMAKPHFIEGLVPGTYKCELLSEVGADIPYWSMSGIVVNKGSVTELKNLNAFVVR